MHESQRPNLVFDAIIIGWLNLFICNNYLAMSLLHGAKEAGVLRCHFHVNVLLFAGKNDIFQCLLRSTLGIAKNSVPKNICR